VIVADDMVDVVSFVESFNVRRSSTAMNFNGFGFRPRV
jgi:hypothetical protein